MAKTQAHHLRLVWTGDAGRPTREANDYRRYWLVRIAGKPDLAGSAPSAYGGDDARHNPEDLMLAALSSCHMLSYLALCAKNGTTVTSYEDEASGRLERRDDGRFGFVEVTLRPDVGLGAGDPLVAERLHAEARRICFIANSVNFDVRHEPKLRLPFGGMAPS